MPFGLGIGLLVTRLRRRWSIQIRLAALRTRHGPPSTPAIRDDRHFRYQIVLELRQHQIVLDLVARGDAVTDVVEVLEHVVGKIHVRDPFLGDARQFGLLRSEAVDQFACNETSRSSFSLSSIDEVIETRFLFSFSFLANFWRKRSKRVKSKFTWVWRDLSTEHESSRGSARGSHVRAIVLWFLAERQLPPLWTIVRNAEMLGPVGPCVFVSR